MIEKGFHKFYISTHYKPELVHDHFGNGDKWGISITYIHEEEPLGTAGGLGLLPKERINLPVLVMNGDLITDLDFHSLMSFHKKAQSYATVCVNEYKHTIPYGVIESDGEKIKLIKEKPTLKYFVNAGIYLLSEKVDFDYLENIEV